MAFVSDSTPEVAAEESASKTTMGGAFEKILEILKSMEQRIALPDNPAPTDSPCEDSDVDADVVEAPLFASDASLFVQEQVEAPTTHARLSSFIPMFEPSTPARCSTKCADEKANQQMTALGLGVTPVTSALLDHVRSVPWLPNIGYLAGLQLKPPWPSWIGSGERLQLPLVTEGVTAMGCTPEEDFCGDRVDRHQLAIFLFEQNSVEEQTRL